VISPLPGAQRLGPIDLVRGAGVLMVAGAHLTLHDPRLSAGFLSFYGLTKIALELFFALSGFLMLYTWDARAQKKASYRGFYVRRFFRIMPLWWLVISFYVWWRGFGLDVWALNVTFLFGFVSFVPRFIPLALSWSLFVEEVFYLIFPLLLNAGRRWGLMLLYVALRVLAWAIRNYAGEIDPLLVQNNYHLRSPLTNLYCFALGMLFYELWKSKSASWEVKDQRWWVWPLCFGVLATQALWSIWPRDIVILAVLFAAFMPGRALVPRVITQVVSWIGVRCYFVYLVHTIFFRLTTPLRHWILAQEQWGTSYDTLIHLYLLCALMGICALAEISYRFFESPLNRLGARLAARFETVKN